MAVAAVTLDLLNSAKTRFIMLICWCSIALQRYFAGRDFDIYTAAGLESRYTTAQLLDVITHGVSLLCMF